MGDGTSGRKGGMRMVCIPVGVGRGSRESWCWIVWDREVGFQTGSMHGKIRQSMSR